MSNNSSILDFENLYKYSFNAIPSAVIVTNLNREIVEVNDAFMLMFGYSKREVLGKEKAVIYSNRDDFLQLGLTMYAHRNSSNSMVYEIEYQKKNGETFPAETIGSVIQNDEGNKIGYLVVVKDLSYDKKRNLEFDRIKERLSVLVDIVRLENEDIEKLLSEIIARVAKTLGLNHGFISNKNESKERIIYNFQSGNSIGLKVNMFQTFIHPEVELIALNDFTNLPEKELHFLEFNKVSRFIGKPIIIHGDHFGTLGFYDIGSVKQPFSDIDKQMVLLVGKWVEQVLEKQKK